jgi:hypothetical protein
MEPMDLVRTVQQILVGSKKGLENYRISIVNFNTYSPYGVSITINLKPIEEKE